MRQPFLPVLVICGFVLVSTVAALQDPGARPAKRRSRNVAAADDEGRPPIDGNQPGGPGGFGGPGGMLRMFPVMAVLDADENGEISSKEIKRAAGALRTLDTDENGTLTEDELRPNLPPGGPGAGGPPNGGTGGFGVPRGRGDAEAFVNRAMQFDQDGDGKLNREELGKMASQFGRPPRDNGNPGAGGNGPTQQTDTQ